MIAIFLVACGAFAQDEGSEKIIKLGNPFVDDGHEGRALNVWDLQVFDGKIYLAGGSTVTNVGPINVWAYNPAKQKFIQEYTVEEEAIEHYRVFDDQLYIPAADPTKGDRNKFYRRDVNGQWQKYASPVVKLAHVRDLIKTDNDHVLMVGNNRQPSKPDRVGTTIAIETKDGFSFKAGGIDNVLVNGQVLANFNWFFSVFRYQNRILATNASLRDSASFPGSIAQYSPQSDQFELQRDLQQEFIPQKLFAKGGKYGSRIIYRPWKPVEYQNYLVYPVRSYSAFPDNYRQAYMNSIGFFYKSGLGDSPQQLKLPGKALGEDVVIIGNELYVLANKKRQDDQFTVYVYRTDSLDGRIKWRRVVKFNSASKARSFEYLDDTFYFGLGQDYGEPIANSGDILSYTAQ
ncbi:MAG: hypothetical protein AAFQ80_21250 [Cyanobacteria bacterium J06621_8]